jgi:hypothetical protein
MRGVIDTRTPAMNDDLHVTINTSIDAPCPARMVGRALIEPMAHWLAAGRSHREPSLVEILSDPMTALIMAADGVDPEELAMALTEIRQKLVKRA